MARFKTRQSFLVADASRRDRSSIELACIKFWTLVQDFKSSYTFELIVLIIDIIHYDIF